MATIDTSIEAYKKVGINLTEKQYEDMIDINIMAQGADNKDIPVHFILMTLKALGLIPSELMREVCNDKPTDNSEDISHNELYQVIGIPKKKRSYSSTRANVRRFSLRRYSRNIRRVLRNISFLDKGKN